MGVDAAARTVSPLRSLIKSVKGLSSGAGVKHTSLKNENEKFGLVQKKLTRKNVNK